MGNGRIDTGRRIAGDLADLAVALDDVAGSDAEVEGLCDVVSRTVGADHASITVVKGHVVTVAAATGDEPAQADRLIRQVVSSRCSGRRPATLRMDDLDDLDDLDDMENRGLPPADDQVVGEDLRLHSLLAHVQPAGLEERVVVSAWARRRSAFAPAHEATIVVLGALVTAAVRAGEQQRRADQLENALRTSRRIGAALGIVMATEDVALDEAWSLLRRTSQTSNVRVADLAERVVRHGPYARLDALANSSVPDSSACHW